MKLNFCIILIILSSTFAISKRFDLTNEQITNTAFPLFQNFIKDNNKTYSSIEEYSERFSIFHQNLLRIKTTQDNDKGAEYNINRFADLSSEEFEAYFLGEIDTNQHKSMSFLSDAEYELTYKGLEIPESFDWREKNVVSPVKNQGFCGACWAFSATQVVESHIAIKTGKLNILSPQQLVDCDRTEHGCGGGLHFRALDYIAQKGMVSEKDYPYSGHRHNCTVNESQIVAKVKGYKNITSDENEMAKAIVEFGPLAVGLEASNFQFYWSGISDPYCSKRNNHAVLLVGYGRGRDWLFREKDFWIIKNSWGSWWGEKGYIRLVRGREACGITKVPSIPIV